VAKQGQEFGKAILAVEGDDSQLRATLKRDEALVRASAAKMQSSLKPLAIGQAEVGQTAGAASAAVGVLGATAAATGNQALASAAQIGGMGAAVGGLANAAIAAAAGIKAMTVASLAFLATGLGAALAAVAVAASAVGAVLFINSREQAKANERLAEQESRLKASNKELEKEAKLLRQRIAIAQGADPLSFEGRNRALKIQLREVEAANKLREQEEAKKRVQDERIEALRREISILSGVKTQADFIVNVEERRAFLQIARIKRGSEHT